MSILPRFFSMFMNKGTAASRQSPVFMPAQEQVFLL